MKAKWMILLTGMICTVLLSITGVQSTIAAESKGELKIADVLFGNQVPIPYLEQTAAVDYLKLLYDPLVGSSNDGRLSTTHGLANKWEMSRDKLSWTFYLRRGVKFHDGVEVTAKDVKFSIEQMMRPNSKADGANILRGTIKSIEIKDPYTIVVYTKTPSIMLPGLLSDAKGVECLIQPKDAYEKVGENKFIEHPIGSGPYKWHSQMIGSFIKLEAIEKHWRDGVPRYKYVNFLIIPEESTQVSMLKTGEVDIIRIGRERVAELKNGFNIISKPEAGTVIFNPNMQWTSPVFSDIRFRKALNLAINKEDIIKHIFDGLAKPITTYPGPAIYSCGGDPTIKPYSYDPQEARRLIKEGGWEGFEFTFASYPRAGCPEFQRLVETICGYWEKIGLKPKIMMTDWATWREKWRQRKTEGTISGMNATVEPLCPLMLGRMRRNHYSKSDETSTNDPKMDAIFDKALKSTDMDEMTKLMGDINRHLYDQYYVVSICELDDMIAANKRVPKWDPGRRRNERNYNDLIKQP